MTRSCRFSVLSTVVVLAHGLHYATWTLEGPRASVSAQTTTRVELKGAVDPFDSEQPMREGQARAELLMKSDSVDSGVAYLKVTRTDDKPGHASIEAVMTSMKSAFIATHEANGANIQEMPAGSFPFG